MATTITLNASNGIATLTNAANAYAMVALPVSPDGSTIGSTRIDSDAPLGSPRFLRISHQAVKAKSGVPATDRHVVRIDQTKAASGDTPEATASVYLNMVVPRTQFTTQEIKDMVGELVDLINDLTLLGRLLNNDPIAEV